MACFLPPLPCDKEFKLSNSGRLGRSILLTCQKGGREKCRTVAAFEPILRTKRFFRARQFAARTGSRAVRELRLYQYPLKPSFGSPTEKLSVS